MKLMGNSWVKPVVKVPAVKPVVPAVKPSVLLVVPSVLSPRTNSASPSRTNKYTLFHITPAISSIINGYVLNMANETPESKLRNPSYEKKICERLMSARISASDEKNADLMNPQSTKIADIAT